MERGTVIDTNYKEACSRKSKRSIVILMESGKVRDIDYKRHAKVVTARIPQSPKSPKQLKSLKN
eukprot:6257665-Amphidinium_carterae.1